jgi:RNA polymerase sigma-70 factor (ECF subfamily)
LALRLIEGCSGEEIASAVGLTSASVRVNLHRGLKLLRESLGKEGYP